MKRKILPKNQLAKLILEKACLKGEFTLRSGRKSNYYLDKYLFETEPQILSPLVKALAEILPKKETFDRLAGPELGAVAIAAALSIEAKVPFIIARKDSKGYGTDKLFEGTLNKGERLVIVEDIITSGGQALSSAKRLTEYGCEIVEIMGVIDREEGGREAIEAAGFKFTSLFTKTDLGL